MIGQVVQNIQLLKGKTIDDARFQCVDFYEDSIVVSYMRGQVKTKGVLLALDSDEVALGRRQPTNPRLGHLKIPHHLIKCATTTNAETIHLLLLM